MITAFNIRVYGVLINEKKQVLVSDERIRFNHMEVTKFPGGGLELGEGLKDGIIRECREELGIEIAVTDHLYTTDYFQQSAFNEADQLISVYYLIRPLAPLPIAVNNSHPVYPAEVTESFRFIDWQHFNEDCMTLPVDKIAARLVREKYA